MVLGGTSLFGGEGGMRNTVLGLLIFGVLSNGLNLLPNIPITFKQALQGIVLSGGAVAQCLCAPHRTGAATKRVSRCWHRVGGRWGNPGLVLGGELRC